MNLNNSRRSVAFRRSYNPTPNNDITRTNYIFDVGNDNSREIEESSIQEPNELKDNNKSFFESIPQNSFTSPIKTNNRFNPSLDFSDASSENFLFNGSNQNSPVLHEDIKYDSSEMRQSFLTYYLFENLNNGPKIPQISKYTEYSRVKAYSFLNELELTNNEMNEKLSQFFHQFIEKPPQILKDIKINKLNEVYQFNLIQSYLKCLNAILQIKKHSIQVSKFISNFKEINQKSNEKFQAVTFLPRSLNNLKEERDRLDQELQNYRNIENLYDSLRQFLSFSILKIEKNNYATIEVPYQKELIRTNSLSSLHSNIAQTVRDREFMEEIDEIGKKIPVLGDKKKEKYTFLFSVKGEKKIRFKIFIRKIKGYPWTKFIIEDVKVIFGNEAEIKRLVMKTYQELPPQRKIIYSFITTLSSLFGI